MLEPKKIIHRNIRDNLYRKILKNEDHAKDIYHLATGEHISEKLIHKTLDSGLVNREYYNDSSFLSDNEVSLNNISIFEQDGNYFILFEHQSSRTSDEEGRKSTQNIYTRIEGYANDLIELNEKEIKDRNNGVLPDNYSVPEIKALIVYNGKDLEEYVHGKDIYDDIPNNTGLDIKSIDARYDSLITRFGFKGNENHILFKVGYFFKQYDTKLTELNDQNEDKEIDTRFSINTLPKEMREELQRIEKARRNMNEYKAYVYARDKCRENDYYFSEIGGIEAMATNKLLERNDYGEDAYEDLKKRQLEYAIKKEDSLLQKGRQEGEAIGIQKGEAIGIQKGEAIGIQKGEAIGKIKTMLELKVDYLQIRKLLDKPGFTKEIFLEALISADRDGIKLPKPALEQLKYSGIKTINQGRDINNNNRVR